MGDIRNVALKDLHALNRVIDEVCRERRYLATTVGFPVEGHREFLKNIIDNNIPQVVALLDNEIIGWCDILPVEQEGFTHVGYLGMGLLKKHRGLGIGESLLIACLERAQDYGYEKIELEVFSDNTLAIKLYEKTGFTLEGTKHKARKIEGNYQDISMYGMFLKEIMELKVE